MEKNCVTGQILELLLDDRGRRRYIYLSMLVERVCFRTIGFVRDMQERFQRLANHQFEARDWQSVIAIGNAARQSDLSVSALRKYGAECLIIYHRTATGRRLLSKADVDRVRVIQHLIGGLGLNIEGIRRLMALLPCWTLMPCPEEDRRKCIAALDPIHQCWMTSQSEYARKGVSCRECTVYQKAIYVTPVFKASLVGEDAGGSAERTEGPR